MQLPQVETPDLLAEAPEGRGQNVHQVSRLHRTLMVLNLTFTDLAAMTGLKVRTLHNVASGNNKSQRARKKIEAALGVTLWPLVNPPAPTPDALSAEGHR